MYSPDQKHHLSARKGLIMPSIDSTTRDRIRKAFEDEDLKVRSVDANTGQVCIRKVSDVMRHYTPTKRILRISTAGGRSVKCTEDHSLFRLSKGSLQPAEAGGLTVGDSLVIVEGGVAITDRITSVFPLPNHIFTYDLSVPGPENFVLSNGILAHNSYSIGGISLSIEKSSKYESIKQNMEGRFDKFMENKRATTKIMRGLKQSRYGVGVRSSFGPITGKGVLTPRKFMGI